MRERGEGRRGPAVVVQVAASAALALYLVLAWGSGVDRLSTTSPALERLVPGLLRAQADRSAAAVALARGDSAAALLFASHAVRKDPGDPLSNSLLGSARQYRGDAAGAEAAFRVAAARGWRDRLTQLYWYGAAMGAGDAERAALRADALLRSDPNFAAAGTLLDPLEASPGGRAALARRLAENPGWAATYLAVSGDAAAEKVRLKSEIALMATRDKEGSLDCETPRPLVTALVERGMRRDAERLWRAACGGGELAGFAGGGLFDGGFEQLAAESEASPFGWRKHARGDVKIESVAERAGGHSLVLHNSAAVSRLMLTQALGLTEGRYRVRAKVLAGNGQAAGRIAFSLDCGAKAGRPSNTNGDAATTGQLLAIGTCDSQTLGLWLRPGGVDVTLDDLAIERLP